MRGQKSIPPRPAPAAGLRQVGTAVAQPCAAGRRLNMSGAARLELIPQPPELAEPVILGGRYRLIRQLMEGGMGSVWYAEHLTLRSPVAVKLITLEGNCSEESLQRFLHEARAGAALRSPHVVQILDYGLHEGLPYLVMELLVGESLADRLNRVGALGVRTTERIVSQVARALTRAHDAGVVHRDLKPENIFLVDDADDLLVKLLDFGIAKSSVDSLTSLVAAQHTRTGMFIGTPQYASPEQIEGVSALDYRTDIWSLGVVAYECLLGQTLFSGDTIGKIMVEICSQPLPIPSERGFVPDGFDAWFARACSRDPDQRFQSAREAATELTLLCGGPAYEAPVSRDVAWRGARPASRRRPGVLAATKNAALCLSLALASGAAGFTVSERAHSEQAPSIAVLPVQPLGATLDPAAPTEELVPSPAPTEAATTAMAIPSGNTAVASLVEHPAAPAASPALTASHGPSDGLGAGVGALDPPQPAPADLATAAPDAAAGAPPTGAAVLQLPIAPPLVAQGPTVAAALHEPVVVQKSQRASPRRQARERPRPQRAKSAPPPPAPSAMDELPDPVDPDIVDLGI